MFHRPLVAILAGPPPNDTMFTNDDTGVVFIVAASPPPIILMVAESVMRTSVNLLALVPMTPEAELMIMRSSAANTSFLAFESPAIDPIDVTDTKSGLITRILLLKLSITKIEPFRCTRTPVGV